mmetsp:Transcript_360/g.508  ORF Transcript_360/g.508 Transcript_360/m.508 type:complete len:177 (+) Transcript_360:14-544(+)
MSDGGINDSYALHVDESVLSGYLHKKTREGKWQKRWFEINGIYLTYYKSKKMEKLLAALSLAQVGEIKVISCADDVEKLNGLFSIELNTRIYTLRAATDSDAAQWVTVLNKIKSEGVSQTIITRVNSNVTNSSDGSNKTPAIQSFDISSKSTDKPSDRNSDWLKSGRPWYRCGCCS